MSKLLVRKILRRSFIFALVALGLQQAWRHGHDYIIPERFAVVERGKVYRGAWLKDWPMRQVVRTYQIRTIVALAHQPDYKLATEEKQLAQKLGVRWIHIPIVDDRSVMDPDVLCDRLDEAAQAVADPANQPVYFHCHHGINRASMVQMAYRMKYCGWTLEQATAEIDSQFGLRSVDRGPDYRFMTQFYRRRVLPHRNSAEVEQADAGITTPVR